jgi:predicted dehydrogenase
MIGLGLIAPFYAAALDQISGAELAAVCDINPARIVPYRRAGLREFTDYRSLLACAEVDAVLINAPNDRHFALAGAALAAGKHVCCEKPLTTRLADAIELLDVARRSGKTLFTAFHRRYNRNFRLRLAELSDRSKIASVSAEYLERIEDHAGSDGWYLDPKRCGGGCIADNGPNVFDSLCSFLGPLTVTSVQVVRNRSIDVKASVQLISHENIPVHVFLDWEYDQGEKKQLTVLLKDGQTIGVDFLEGFTEFKGSLWHEYEGVIEDFLGHVKRGQSDGLAGCEAARMVEAAYGCEVSG